MRCVRVHRDDGSHRRRPHRRARLVRRQRGWTPETSIADSTGADWLGDRASSSSASAIASDARGREQLAQDKFPRDSAV
jgi:hypothetical protein